MSCPTPLALATYIYEATTKRKANQEIEDHLVDCDVCYHVWEQLSQILAPPTVYCLLTAWATAEIMLQGSSIAWSREVEEHCQHCEVCQTATVLVHDRLGHTTSEG